MDPKDKCEHGVYKAGEAIAVYCSICNPACNTDVLAHRPGRTELPFRRTHTTAADLDCTQFMEQPLGARLAFSLQ